MDHDQPRCDAGQRRPALAPRHGRQRQHRHGGQLQLDTRQHRQQRRFGVAVWRRGASVPGVVEVENFDEGGQDIAYVDLDAGNAGAAYRSGDVDIAAVDGASEDTHSDGRSRGSGCATRSMPSRRDYRLEFRVASAGRGGTFHLEVNGENVTGTLAVPDTGGWDSWTTVGATVTLGAGPQVWRLVMDANGDTSAVGNFDAIAATAGDGSTAFGGVP